MDNHTSNNYKNRFSILYVILGVILLISVAVSIYVFYYYTTHVTIGTDNASGSRKWTVVEWGAFGDYFGGTLSPLLGFFGLFAVLLTLAMQIHELSISIREMKEQSGSLKRQNFERSFFTLVEFHNDIVNDMDLRDIIDAEVTAQGRDVFHTLFRRVWDIYKRKIKQIPDEKERVIAAYEEFLKDNEHHVGHYFRNLYRIYKFIDESDAFENEREKRNYSGIIRAQLSSYELALLFFNSLHPNGAPFKKYIEKYAVLENFRYKHMKEEFNLSEGLYGKSAWGTPK